MLTENWLVEGLSDYEYKKYLFLAFLQKNDLALKEKRLYPALSELIGQHRYLKFVKEEKEKLQADFPKTITGIDEKELKFTYQSVESETQELEIINSLIDFAIPRVENELRFGKSIYHEAEESLTIDPIGILPIYKNEGLIFIKPMDDKILHLYQYQLSAIQLSGEAFRGVYLNFIGTWVKKIGETFESLKLKLIKQLKIVTVPATYLMEYNKYYPYEETILPIAKRKLITHLEL